MSIGIYMVAVVSAILMSIMIIALKEALKDREEEIKNNEKEKGETPWIQIVILFCVIASSTIFFSCVVVLLSNVII